MARTQVYSAEIDRWLVSVRQYGEERDREPWDGKMSKKAWPSPSGHETGTNTRQPQHAAAAARMVVANFQDGPPRISLAAGPARLAVKTCPNVISRIDLCGLVHWAGQ